MAGLARICKSHGAIVINGTRWVWDYVNDKAVPEKEMTPAQRRASDKAWAESLKQSLVNME